MIRCDQSDEVTITTLTIGAEAARAAGATFEDAVAAAVNRAILGERQRCGDLLRHYRDIAERAPAPVGPHNASVLNQMANILELRPNHCRRCFDGGLVPSGLAARPDGAPQMVRCACQAPQPANAGAPSS